ncbi:MAG: trigger factor [Candidatus Caldatribacteriota bacterium]|nr:trigger factor [Candidatus Caldatribacteriota bacterium]
MIDYKIKEQKDGEVTLEVKVDNSKVKDELNNTYNNSSSKVKIPGFRKGKIPRNILNMHLGKEYFYKIASEELIKKTYYEAIEKSKIEPIDRPDIKIVQIEEDKPLIYEIKVKVRPEVKIGDLSKITVKKEINKIKTDDVNNELKRLQENKAELKVKKGGKTKENDFILFDSESFIDGKELDNSKMKDQLMQLGKNTPPEIIKELIGCSEGEEKEIEIRIPKDGKDDKFAGKSVVHKIKIKEIKEKELPEMNDEFAKKLGSYKNLDDFKKALKKDLEKREENDSKTKYENDLMDEVSEICEVKIPDVLIDREIDYMIKSLEEDLKRKNMNLKDYLKSIKADENKLRKEYKEVAEKRVKNELILDKISKDEKIEASEKDVKKRIKDIAEEIKQDALKVEASFKKNNTIGNLKETIKRKKVIDFLSKKIKVNSLKKEVKSK